MRDTMGKRGCAQRIDNQLVASVAQLVEQLTLNLQNLLGLLRNVLIS
jgi:hypothetical protein